MHHTIAKFAAAAIIAGGATVALALPASAANNVVVTGHCSKTSVADLQVQREDTGQLSVDFGVDMARHVAGVTWKVKATDNGVTFVNTTARTISDGSFSVSRLIHPQAGTNHIVASATNPATGETCSLRASL